MSAAFSRLFFLSLAPWGEGRGEGVQPRGTFPLTLPASGWVPPSPHWGEGTIEVVR